MKKFVLMMAGIAAFAAPANAQAVLSENFESGSGAFVLTGNAVLATSATYSVCCGTPNDSTNSFVAFGGGDLPSGIAGASFTTLLGQLYDVTFDYGAFGNGSEALVFSVDGQSFTFNPVADNGLVNTFQPGQFSFIGSGAATNLLITSSGGNGVDALVDNVAVNAAVPEPATWGMMLLGFAGVGTALRRRRRFLPQAA